LRVFLVSGFFLLVLGFCSVGEHNLASKGVGAGFLQQKSLPKSGGYALKKMYE
jgi:hypothetical protein